MTASLITPCNGGTKGAAHVLMDARLLKFCQSAIEKRIADAKKSNDHARYISLCTAARIIKQELKIMEALGE